MHACGFSVEGDSELVMSLTNFGTQIPFLNGKCFSNNQNHDSQLARLKKRKKEKNKTATSNVSYLTFQKLN